MKKELVAIYRAPNEMTAHIVRAALEEAGIQVMVKSYHSSCFDGMFIPADGSWGEILVRQDQSEKAVEILEDYLEESADQEEV